MFTTETFADILTAATTVVLTDLGAGVLIAAGGVAGLSMYFLRRAKSAVR